MQTLDLLTRFGLAMARVAEATASSRFFTKAKALAPSKSWSKDTDLEKIAPMQAAAGDLPGAWKTASAIGYASIRLSAFERIVVALINAGNLSGAWKAAEDIPAPDYRSHAYFRIAMALAQAGNVTGAWQAADAAHANATEGDRASGYPYKSIPLALAGGGYPDAARQAIDQLPDHRDDALFRLAIVYAKAGELDAATSITRSIAKWPCDRHWQLISQKWLERGNPENAKLAALEIKAAELARRALRAIAWLEAAEGKMATARQTFERIPLAPSNSGNYAEDQIEEDLFRSATSSPQPAHAPRLAMAMADRVRQGLDGWFPEKHLDWVEARISFATAQAEAGLLDSALTTIRPFRDEEELLAVMEYGGYQAALDDVCGAAARAGDFDGAKRIAAMLDDDDRCDNCLALIARQQADAGRIADANSTIDRIKDPIIRCNAWLNAAIVQREANDPSFVSTLRMVEDTALDTTRRPDPRMKPLRAWAGAAVAAIRAGKGRVAILAAATGLDAIFRQIADRPHQADPETEAAQLLQAFPILGRPTDELLSLQGWPWMESASPEAVAWHIRTRVSASHRAAEYLAQAERLLERGSGE
jgi:hypothetical protein